MHLVKHKSCWSSKLEIIYLYIMLIHHVNCGGVEEESYYEIHTMYQHCGGGFHYAECEATSTLHTMKSHSIPLKINNVF